MTSYPFWFKMAESSGGDRDEEFTFRKLFRDLNMHMEVGVRYYKAQRTERNATFYAMYVELKDQLVYSRARKNFSSFFKKRPSTILCTRTGSESRGMALGVCCMCS